MGMSTHKIKGEDYYQCRDVKAERDKLLEEVAELLDRLEAAEKDIALKERIIDAIGSALNAAANERDALRTELAVLRSSMTFRTSLIGRIEAERDALQAKVEAMERQKPVTAQQRFQRRQAHTPIVLRVAFALPGRRGCFLAARAEPLGSSR